MSNKGGNEKLYENANNQTLSHADITKLKKEGKTSEELVDILAKSSKTFESKTQYSQEKFLKKKKKKYSNEVSFLKPTLPR